jgi:N-methylhydantoinase B
MQNIDGPDASVITDPIELEILRSRLEAIGEEAGQAIEKTAISTVVSESKDYSVTLCDAEGDLVVATGSVRMHFGGSSHAVRATLARYGDTIAPGDVFIANDPHNGGGLHPQDIVVQRPIFVDGGIIAWSAISAHMMDLGGMAPGSWAPDAVECYQEALRVPPVRLFRAGEEVTEVWEIFRNNVRIPDVIEMDMRSCVVGTHVVEEKVLELAGGMGTETFLAGIRGIDATAERELRRRIASLADGVYRSVESIESGEEVLRVACTLTIDGEQLSFDLTDAPPQVPHFFNSKAFIVHSTMVEMLHPILAADLPFSQALYGLVAVRCRPGTVVDSELPAAIAAAHMDCAMVVSAIAVHCLQLAIGASPAPAVADRLATPHGVTWGVTTWSYSGWSRGPSTFVLPDGSFIGTAAGADRDGIDIDLRLLGVDVPVELPDVEIYETTYPVLVGERRSRPGVAGAGRWRAGAGCQETFRLHGTERFVGNILGQRGWFPSMGSAGGNPGATTSLEITRVDGRTEPVPLAAAGFEIHPGEWFRLNCGSGGGFGDPLDREPERVADDIGIGRITEAEALDLYGVVLRAGEPDLDATARRRDQMRRDRLDRAQPAVQTPEVAEDPDSHGVATIPLYPGVVQRGNLAVAELSGAVLAVAPDHWTDGCPRIEERTPTPMRSHLVVRTYLDPRSGRALHVEAVPEGAGRAFDVLPRHWLEAGRGPEDDVGARDRRAVGATAES